MSLTASGRITRAQQPRPDWLSSLAKYDKPDRRKAIWQLLNTLIPYAILWALAVWTIKAGMSYWLTLAVIVPTCAFYVRTFIFFHDCGHGSFFRSKRANTITGYITGILTFTPYDRWRHSHALHHASAGDLDRRGTGDVWTMTVAEYQAAPRLLRLGYRLVRHPLIMFGLGPIFVFVIAQRIPPKGGKLSHILSVHITNLALLTILVLAHFTIGLKAYVLVQLPILVIAGAVGVWLFYVQHQFEGTYWARHSEWDPIRAAMEGSSYYKLPRVLQWATGSIGLHHIHHLRSRIPNYHLQRCYDEVPAVQAVKPVRLWESLRCVRLNLWDEERQRLVSFRAAKALGQQGAA